jgi:hypothetical protein
VLYLHNNINNLLSLKFVNFTSYTKLYEEHGGDHREIFKAVAREYIEKAGGNTAAIDKKVDFVVKAADSVAHLEDPSVKIKKASRELAYDAGKMDALKAKLVPYMSKTGKAPSGYDGFWESLQRSLKRLSESDNDSYEKVIKGMEEKKVKLTAKEGVFHGNLFEDIKDELKISGSAVDQFLIELYALNARMGNNPSGKGEYLLDLFVENAVKSSDVDIDGVEYEIKTTAGAAIGETLGSKVTYAETLKGFFEKSEGSVEWEYDKYSLNGDKFKSTWAPIFLGFSIDSKDLARDFLNYQYTFYMQKEHSKKFMTQVEEYLDSPGIEKLAEVYDTMCIEYIKTALASGKKTLLVFEEKNAVPSGKYVAVDYDSIDRGISFAGSDTHSPVKIRLPKSSATMRPEIEKIRIKE